jgi:hypothetical protein
MYDASLVRTTLDIDADVLQAAKDIAARRRTTAGRVLSELARSALEPAKHRKTTRNGVPLLPPRDGEGIVTTDLVNRLRDEA